MNTDKIIKIVERTDKDFALALVPAETILKFAELIIRECAKIVNDNDFDGSTVGDDLLFEHFGVE